MNYRSFVSDTPEVSEIGLGAWQLGENAGWKSMTEKEAILLVHRALDLGINFFDTAPNYGCGSSEERLGKALVSTNRENIVINSKFGHQADGQLNFDAHNIRKSIEKSLRRLQTDYLDSVILHNPPAEILDGTKAPHYEIFEQLIEEGKIKAYGASIDTADEMKLLMDTTQSKVMEVFFNILHQDTARGFEQAKAKGIGLIVKIPLDSGWLTGKYHANSTFNDIRKRWSKKDIETRAKLIDKVKKILEIQEGLAQKALAFCLSYDAVSTVIPGNSSVRQLESNAKSAETILSTVELKALQNFYQNEISSLRLPW